MTLVFLWPVLLQTTLHLHRGDALCPLVGRAEGTAAPGLARSRVCCGNEACILPGALSPEGPQVVCTELDGQRCLGLPHTPVYSGHP